MNIILTGGAGTIGKAFVNLLHKDHKITVIDNNEWSLAQLQDEFNIETHLMDFGDYTFSELPCEVVIHCAAYKHVNLGEENVSAFIDNNVNKTRKLFKEAQFGGADILFISTDKAVEPSSLYGYTKAIGEKLTETYNGTVARLPNILSSTGSVIPVWEQQIEEDRPITITDDHMMRYVIEDYDAVNQVWHSYLAGDKLIIPTCEERRLLDILGDVLERHGTSAEGYTAGIDVIGMRPGERLREKLKWKEEE